MFCGECGAKNADTGKFCTGCGSPLTASGRLPVQPPPVSSGGGGTTATAVDCAKCGASIQVQESAPTATCEYCDTSLVIERSDGNVYSSIKGDLEEIKAGVASLRRDSDRLVAVTDRGASASERLADEAALSRLSQDAQKARRRLGVVSGRVTDLLEQARAAHAAYREELVAANSMQHASLRSHTVVRPVLQLSIGLSLLGLCSPVGPLAFVFLFFLLILYHFLQNRLKAGKAKIEEIATLEAAAPRGDLPAEFRQFFNGTAEEQSAAIDRAVSLEAEVRVVRERLGALPESDKPLFHAGIGRGVAPNWPRVPLNLSQVPWLPSLGGSSAAQPARANGAPPTAPSGSAAPAVAKKAAIGTVGGAGALVLGCCFFSMFMSVQRERNYREHVEKARAAVRAGDWDRAQSETDAAKLTGHYPQTEVEKVDKRISAERAYAAAKKSLEAKDWNTAYAMLKSRIGVLKPHHSDVEELLAQAIPHVRDEHLARARAAQDAGKLAEALHQAQQALSAERNSETEKLVTSLLKARNAERERLAREKAKADQEAKAEQERVAREKAEAERKAKAEQERLAQEAREEAARVVEELTGKIQKDPENAALYLERAKAKQALGDAKAAALDLEASLQRDPAQSDADKIAADIEKVLGRKPSLLRLEVLGASDEVYRQGLRIGQEPKRGDVLVDFFTAVSEVSDVRYEQPTVTFKLRILGTNALSDAQYKSIKNKGYLGERLLNDWSKQSQAKFRVVVEFFDSLDPKAAPVSRLAGQDSALLSKAPTDAPKAVSYSYADRRSAPETSKIRRVRVLILY